MRYLHAISLLLSIFAFGLIQGQSQIVSRKINLQINERYNLRLEEFYNFAASSFTYPEDFPLTQRINPFQQFGKEVLESPIYLASFEGYESKYFIGFNRIDNNVVLFTYYRIIVQNTGELVRQDLSQQVPQFKDFMLDINASFYNIKSGFITATSSGSNVLIHFQYSDDRGLAFTQVNNQWLQKHQSIYDPRTGNIFIIYFEQEQATLCVYDPSANELTQSDSQSIPKDIRFYNYLITTYSLMITENGSCFINFTPNFSTKKLKIQIIDDPIKQQGGINKIYQFRDLVVITIQAQYNLSVLTFKQQLLVDNTQLQLIKVSQVNTQISQEYLMIDENYIVYKDENYLTLININTQKKIFTTQLQDQSSFFISSSLYIGNTFFLTYKDIFGQDVYVSVKFQIPQVIFYGQAQTYKFNALSSQSQYWAEIEIAINITESMITSTSMNSVLKSYYLTQFTDQFFSISVESYITGSNLNPKIDSSASTNLKNISFNKLVNLQTQQSYNNTQFQNMYHTDGFISSILVSKTANSDMFILTAATPNITESNVSLFSLANPMNLTIGEIDNYGAFLPELLLNKNSKSIFVPFINSFNQLEYNEISDLQCDSSTYFTFASYPSQNVLFVQCGGNIQQIKYSFVSGGSSPMPSKALILLQKSLLIDFSNFQKQIICLNGILIIIGDNQVRFYNYFGEFIYDKVITIPQLSPSTKQQLIFFSKTFFIVVLNNLILKIDQYSYGDLTDNLSNSPLFLRHLIIDNSYIIDPNLNFIPKRNQIEYLFLGTVKPNQFLIYRVDSPSSQNQFYSNVTILSDAQNIPVINSQMICVLSNAVRCSQILEQASIFFQWNASPTIFNNILQQSNLLTLVFGDQQIVFNIQILRDASTQYGIVNQNDQSIQNFRTQLQENDIKVNSTLSFNDQKLFNACLLGWESKQNGSDIILTNRLAISQINQTNVYVSQILFGLKVTLSLRLIKIGDFLTFFDKGIKNSCKMLNDEASYLQNDAYSFSTTLYTFCQDSYYILYATFFKGTNGDIANVVITRNQTQQYYTRYSSPQDFQQLVTISGRILLINLIKSQTFAITNNQLDQISNVENPISYNYINSLKIQLEFFKNGIITVKNSDKGQYYQTTSIQELLVSFLFSLSANDSIQTVIQLSDNQFMIQFSQSFMYEVIFSLGKENSISIAKAKLYYYKDGLENLNFVLMSSKYTLIFGIKQYYPVILLYTNGLESSNQLLIESVLFQQFRDQNVVLISFAEFISDSQVKVYFTKQYLGDLVLNISELIQLQFTQRYPYQYKFSIYPISFKTIQESYLNFTINPQQNPIPSISLREILSLQNLFVLLLLFIFI